MATYDFECNKMSKN